MHCFIFYSLSNACKKSSCSCWCPLSFAFVSWAIVDVVVVVASAAAAADAAVAAVDTVNASFVVVSTPCPLFSPFRPPTQSTLSFSRFFVGAIVFLLAGGGITGGGLLLSRFTNAPLAHTCTCTRTYTLQPSARSVAVNISVWNMRFICFLIHFISLFLFSSHTHLFLFLSFSSVFSPFSFSARNLLLCCSVTGAIISGVARYDCMTFAINSFNCIQIIFIWTCWHIKMQICAYCILYL